MDNKSLSYFPLVCLCGYSGAGQLSVQSCCSPIASASVAAPRLHRSTSNCCSLFPSASAAVPQLRPLQLLLAACVRFSCCSLIHCVRFNCCSPIASACGLTCSGRFQHMPSSGFLPSAAIARSLSSTLVASTVLRRPHKVSDHTAVIAVVH